jgi:hypothetical protein
MQDSIKKQLKQKRADGMAQVIEHQPSKHKALSSTLPHPKKKKEGRKEASHFTPTRLDILKIRN